MHKQGRLQKNFQEGGAKEKPRLRNKPPSTLSVANWGRTGHVPRAHLKETLHQVPM